MSSGDSEAPQRTYRSSKRSRPCDRCRERKLKCELEGPPPCHRCRTNEVPCSFVGRPRRRLGRSKELGGVSAESSPGLHSQELAASPGLSSPQPYAHSVTPALDLQQSRSVTQLSHSMDQISGHTAQLLGASSEGDPWLLRHCRFDELGLRSFHKVHFRHAGGVPTGEKIPVHFLISADELYDNGMDSGRARLDALLDPGTGARLVRLFHMHVFPVLPVLSRSHLGFTGADAIPSEATIQATPTHLLAAIYASALAFSAHDDALAVMSAYDRTSVDELWNIAYRDMERHLHRPTLSVLQAAILYLHKRPSPHQHALSDSPALWSLMGNVVGLAHSLGLHLECRMFGIPAREKRLRRRLWWALYIEDKWLSLLLGRPPYLRQSEWDTSTLDDIDFECPAFPHADKGLAFRDMARLAAVAESIQESFYSLRACQAVSEDLYASIQAAKPLFDQLNAWRASVNIPEPFHCDRADKYPITVYFAYLTLVTYVWRALLRPTVRSLPPPEVIDVDQPFQGPQLVPDTAFFFEDLSWDFSELPEIELHLEDNVTDTSATIKELHQAAQGCAGNLVGFTAAMVSADFGEFWHAWSRIGFAVISNFLMTLLVQAPNSENAAKAKSMLEDWKGVIRNHGNVSPLMALAMTRLNGFYWAGLADVFCLPPHVLDVL